MLSGVVLVKRNDKDYVLATWEAKIGKIKVQDQPWQIVKLHLQNNQSKLN
jgi:hypothetical protein